MPVSDAGLRKAYKYKLKPTMEQERQLVEVVWQCRMLYNTALEQRITLYCQRGVTLTCYQQQAELPDVKAAFPGLWRDTLARSCRMSDAPRQNLPGVLSPGEGRTNARLPPLSGA